MSNYQLSVLNTGQAKVSAKYQQPEQRRKVPTVMELALKNQEVSIPNANELRKSALRPVETYYLMDIAAGVGTAKAYNHTGNYSDSGKQTFTYITHVETFKLPRKIAQNNVFEYQALFNNLYEMAWKNLRTRHDNSALAFLYSNRVQLSAATMDAQMASAAPGNFSDANKALEIAMVNQKLFVQKAKNAMRARKLNGDYDVIADLQLAAQMEYDMNQGNANSVNTGFQFAGISVATTQDVVDSNYANGSSLWLPKGLFAGMVWNDAYNKAPMTQDPGGSIGTFGMDADPFGSGAVADVSLYTQRADTSANTYGGDVQDIVDQWEFAVTIAYVAPPLSTENDSVIMEIGQAA